MGKTKVSNNTESMDSMLSAYTKYLPTLISQMSAQQPEVAQGNLNATLATQPIYDALNLAELQRFGVPLAEAGQQVTRSNALAGGEINRDQILGSGGQAALAADSLSRAINPNYYDVQDASSAQAKNLLNSINLSGLSGGEQAAVERSLAQSNVKTGNLGNQNATNTIGNAMNFGGAFNQKLSTLGNALNTANGVAASAQNTGFNPVNVALGQPNTSTAGNFGTNQFTNTNANTQAGSLNANTQSSNNFMNGIFQRGLANGTQTTSNSPWNMIGGLIGGGGGCCFILLEFGELPWYVRACRDRYYRRMPQIARGYCRMAKWLVPLMRTSRAVKWLVWKTMVKPITEHGQFVVRLNGTPHKIVRKFWFAVWHILGK